MPGYNRLNLPDSYRVLLDLDATGFAWEWLRRNAGYRALWAAAGPAVRRFAERAMLASHRTGFTMIGRHPLAASTAPWGLTFPTDPDTPAIVRPPLGWSPELRTDTLSLVRPLSWARTIAGLTFTPERWGVRAIMMKALGGTHMLVRRHGSPELALWLPAGLAPRVGESFGLYLHPDLHVGDRLRAAAHLRCALGIGPPLCIRRHSQAWRQIAMLCIHDLAAEGASLRDIAGRLLPAWPCDWRSSPERSDLRRLAEAAATMVTGGWRILLTPPRRARRPAQAPSML